MSYQIFIYLEDNSGVKIISIMISKIINLLTSRKLGIILYQSRKRNTFPFSIPPS